MDCPSKLAEEPWQIACRLIKGGRTAGVRSGGDKLRSYVVAFEPDVPRHDQIVRDIAAARFDCDEWDVVVNGRCTPDGRAEVEVPDIVATNCSRIVAAGEVETFDSITDEQARRWKEIGESCVRFYLYIPEGTEKEVARLAAKHEVECAGIRSYSYNSRLEIKAVHIENPRCRDDDHPWWLALATGSSSDA